MIADQYKCIGHSDRAKTYRQGDLRGLINDTVIEFAFGKDRAEFQSALIHLLHLSVGLTGLFRDML